MDLVRFVFRDWSCNRSRPHIQVFLVTFRAAQYLRSRRGLALLGAVASGVNRLIGLFLVSIDIPVSTSIGARLRIHHGFGLVIHNEAVIGTDVTLRHGVTIGSTGRGRAPILEDGVDVGTGALILGPVTVGRSSIIGAGSVVVKDVPVRAVVAGNPARILRLNGHDSEALRTQ